MRNWWKSNWRIGIVNGVGASVLLALIIATLNDPWQTSPHFTQLFEGSGLWAIRFLLFCLAMSPLNTYLGWRGAIKLRKTAGLWAFTFGMIHFLYYSIGVGLTVEMFFNATYYILGGLALSILTALAITSNRWAMKRLGKNWKRLHRLVYIAGVAVVLHATLAYASSKKAFLDPTLKTELNIYLVVMLVLLALRLPFVRGVLKSLLPTRPFPTFRRTS